MKTALDLLAEDEARTTRAASARPERRSVGPQSLKAPGEALLNLFGSVAKSGANVSENLAYNVPTFRACVDIRASLLAMLPLHLYRRTRKGPERISPADHPLARLFRRRVSGAHTSYQWRHVCSVAHDVGGTAYSLVRRNAFAQIESIVWVKRADIEPYINEQTGELSYLYRGRKLFGYEVLKVANLSTNGYTGRSVLADLRETVGLSLAAEEFTARSFVNGNRKPGIFVGGPTTGRDKAEEFLKFWLENYAGSGNAGKSPVLFGGMDWKDAGFSNADAELLMQRKFSVEEMARVFRLPLHLVGGTEKSTTWGSGIEQLNQGLVDYTLAPLCKNWEAEMDTTLLSEQEQNDGYYTKFEVNALLRGSPETRARVYQIHRQIGSMDVNQIREIEDWELYPDGVAGDPRQPLNAQGSAAAPASTQPAPTPVAENEETP